MNIRRQRVPAASAGDWLTSANNRAMRRGSRTHEAPPGAPANATVAALTVASARIAAVHREQRLYISLFHQIMVAV